MDRLEFTVPGQALLPAPPAAVWAYLTEPDLMSWSYPGVVAAQTTAGQPGAVGHIYEVHSADEAGQRMHTSRVVHAESRTRLSVITELPGFAGRDDFTLTPMMSGLLTRLEVTSTYTIAAESSGARGRGKELAQRTAEYREIRDAVLEHFQTAVREDQGRRLLATA